MLIVTSCHSDVPGLNFEDAGDSAVHYFLFNYLLQTQRGRSFVVKCGNTQKSAHPPIWPTCKVLRPFGNLHNKKQNEQENETVG